MKLSTFKKWKQKPLKQGQKGIKETINELYN